MLKSENQKKKRKRSSGDNSTNDDGDCGNFNHQKHSNKPSSHTEDFTSRKDEAKTTKLHNYEEEHKSFNDKNGGYAASAKQSNPNFLYEEEHKNRVTPVNVPNTNFAKDPKTSNSPYFNYTNINSNSNSNNNNSNNLINVNTNINNKNYANDVKLTGASGNVNSNNPLNSTNNRSNEVTKNTTNINFKYDPTTNQVQDVNVKVDMDAETAYKLYQDNKKYLPTTQQVISGAKTSANFVQNSGVLNEVASTNNAQQPKKKTGAAADPLSNFFGNAVFGSKSASSASDKNAGAAAGSYNSTSTSSTSNNNGKKGMF